MKTAITGHAALATRCSAGSYTYQGRLQGGSQTDKERGGPTNKYDNTDIRFYLKLIYRAKRGISSHVRSYNFGQNCWHALS